MSGRRFGSLIVALVLAVATGVPAAAQTKVVPQTREQVEASYAPLVKKTAPAVVNIYTKRVVRTRQFGTLFDDPFFRQFFGDSFPFQMPQQRERIQNSLGSGVIVRPDGTVVTNHHVIEGADEITVVLNDRREFPAGVVVDDPKTDLAILRVKADGEPLPFLELRDSDEVEVGDLVLAIGDPFGVGQTVTSGIVSALARTRIGISDMSFFIQTDAAINPGNSGGALVTMDGRLAGINTAIFSKSGGSHGIGFAIPSNMVRAVLAGARGDGSLVRPWLGAWGQPVTGEVAATLGLRRPVGVIVTEVYPGSAADKAGLEVGDVVVKVGGHEVDDPGALKFRVATLPVGETATFEVIRKGEPISLRVRMAPPPETPPRDTRVLDGPHPAAGAEVANMSPALAEDLGLERVVPGVAVLRVRQGSPAARYGFEPGDMIREINGRKIQNVQQLAASLSGRAAAWKIVVQRGNRMLSLTVN